MECFKRLILLNYSGSLVLFIIVTITSTCLAGQKIELVTFNYPPIMNAEDANDGMIGQIIHDAFRQVAVEVDILYYPPKRVLNNMIGQDKVAACIGPTALVKRANAEDKVITIPPMVNILMVFCYHKPTHKDKPVQYDKLEELKGYKVGAIQGSNTTKILRAAGLKVYESSIESQVAKLRLGRIDYAAVGYTTGRALIKDMFPGKENDFVYMENKIMELPTSIYFNKAFPGGKFFAGEFKKGFEKIVKTGEYMKILEKYYGKESIPKEYSPLFRELGLQ